jgi:hypothetical protein
MIRHSIAGQDAGIEFPGNASEIWKEASSEILVDERTTVFRPENRVNEDVGETVWHALPPGMHRLTLALFRPLRGLHHADD